MEKVPLHKGEQHSPNLESKEYACFQIVKLT